MARGLHVGGLARQIFVVAAAPDLPIGTEESIWQPASASLWISPAVTIEDQKVTVARNPLSTDATNRANQTIISGQDTDALPDDRTACRALQALAGLSWSDGGQIFIDGFSADDATEGLDPRNPYQNPFSAENDQASGRIEILPARHDKLRGSSFFNLGQPELSHRFPVVAPLIKSEALVGISVGR